MSEIAVHHDYPLIMIRRKIKCLQAFEYSFEYRLDNLENDFFIQTETGECGIDIHYCTSNNKKGLIHLFSDITTTSKAKGDIYSLTFDIPVGETEAAFYILLCDSIDNDNYFERSDAI